MMGKNEKELEIENEMMEKLSKWIDEGTEVYFSFVESSDDKLAKATLDAVRIYQSALEDEEKIAFQSQMLGQFLNGLSEVLPTGGK